MDRPQYSRLLKLIFYDMTAYLKKFLYNIHSKQKALKGTPNFTFKGNSYILSQDEAIKSLDKSIKDEVIEYLTLVKDVETKRETIAEYISVNIPTGISKELLIAFPKSYLEDWYEQSIDDEIPDEDRPKDYLAIKEILDYIKVFSSL